MSRKPDHRITLRLKPDEYARLVAMAGDTPLSAYIRQQVFPENATKRAVKPRRIVPNKKLVAQVLALLGAHHRIKEFKRVAQQVEDGIRNGDDETKLLISETRDWLKRIHTLLMKALRVSAS